MQQRVWSEGEVIYSMLTLFRRSSLIFTARFLRVKLETPTSSGKSVDHCDHAMAQGWAAVLPRPLRCAARRTNGVRSGRDGNRDLDEEDSLQERICC